MMNLDNANNPPSLAIVPSNQQQGTAIDTRAYLVSLNISMCTFRKFDKALSLEVTSAHAADTDMARVNKRLLPKGCLDEFTKLSGRARNCVYKYTLPWYDNGQRILPVANQFKLGQELQAIQYDWDNAVDEFEQKYPRYMADALAAGGSLVDLSEYPDPSRVREKFSFELIPSPIPDQDDFRRKLTTSEADALASKYARRQADAYESGVKECFSRMAELVAHMSERLSAYGSDLESEANTQRLAEGKEARKASFKNSLVSNIQDLINLLPALNLTGNSDISDITKRMQNELCKYSPETLKKSPAAREATAKAAEDILKAVSDFI